MTTFDPTPHPRTHDHVRPKRSSTPGAASMDNSTARDRVSASPPEMVSVGARALCGVQCVCGETRGRLEGCWVYHRCDEVLELRCIWFGKYGVCEVSNVNDNIDLMLIHVSLSYFMRLAFIRSMPRTGDIEPLHTMGEYQSPLSRIRREAMDTWRRYYFSTAVTVTSYHKRYSRLSGIK